MIPRIYFTFSWECAKILPFFNIINARSSSIFNQKSTREKSRQKSTLRLEKSKSAQQVSTKIIHFLLANLNACHRSLFAMIWINVVAQNEKVVKISFSWFQQSLEIKHVHATTSFFCLVGNLSHVGNNIILTHGLIVNPSMQTYHKIKCFIMPIIFGVVDNCVCHVLSDLWV